MSIRWSVRLLFFLAASVSVYAFEPGAYTDPVYMGNYVSEPDDLFNMSLPKNSWVYEKSARGEHFAVLDHKGYQIRALLTVDGTYIRISLANVVSDRCGQADCYSDKRVLGWLMRLRIHIAREITVRARNQMWRH